MQDLVSVMVPVYNVEPYLRECLDSIIKQTYVNLQIILVDDGSTDLGGEICDEYGAKDSRIEVIHKANAGLSAARNSAMEIAKGRWYVFVDSDDYIDENFVKIMLEKAQKDALGICCCAAQEFGISSTVHGKSKGTFTSEEILDLFLSGGQIYVAAWGKLYHRDIFDGISYKVGFIYEDMYIFADLIDRADKIGAIDDILYHYRVRKDSIMGKNYNDFKGTVNAQTSCKELIFKKYPQLRDKFERYYYKVYKKVMNKVVCRNMENKKELLKELRDDLNARDVLKFYMKRFDFKLVKLYFFPIWLLEFLESIKRK